MVESKKVYEIQWTSQYKKDVRKAKKRNYPMQELYDVISKLAN